MNVTLPNGVTINGVPDDATKDQIRLKAISSGLAKESDFGQAAPGPAPIEQPESGGILDAIKSDFEKGTKNLKQDALGVLRGAAGIGNTLLAAGDKVDEWLGTGPQRNLEDLVTGKKPKTPYEQRAEGIDQGLISMGANPDSWRYKGGKIVGEMAGTAGLGPVIGGAVKAVPFMAPLGEAIATSGMSSGALKGLAGGATKVAGGATAGGAQLGMIDPESAPVGAAIGGALPGVIGAGAKVGAIGTDLFRPLFESGQKTISARQLFQMAQYPEESLQALKAYNEAGRQLVPGSAPTTAAVTGDIGLSGLQRTLNNRYSEHGGFSALLTERAAAQNAARTGYLDEIAGNPGKIETAKEARDQVTADLREKALDAAGSVNANQLLLGIEGLLKKPGNAGETAQAALKKVGNAIARATDAAGNIDARALYAIRKDDIGNLLSGKLQGESGNLKLASGQLVELKWMIDDTIETASQVGGNPSTWRTYLNKYTEESKPIDQMEKLQDVLRRSQNTVRDAGDRASGTGGDLIISGSKLEGILKNELPELKKVLTDAQLQRLRNVAADAGAAEKANSAGQVRGGSNTAQNLSADNLLSNLLGSKLGGSMPVKTTLGGLLKIPYSAANKEIQTKLNDLALDPVQAQAALEKIIQSQTPLNDLLNPALLTTYRAAPVLPAQRK